MPLPLIKNMHQLKRPRPNPIPLPTVEKVDKTIDTQLLANLTTQIFTSFLSKYENPFSLREEQIDKLIILSENLAYRIIEKTGKRKN